MAKPTPDPLTDAHIHGLKEPQRLIVGEGLHLDIAKGSNGISKLWRLRYRLGGKQNMYAVGRYEKGHPKHLGLAAAKAKAIEAKALIAQGVNPSRKRKLDKLRNVKSATHTFKAVGERWLAMQTDNWTKATYRQRANLLERDIFPAIGVQPIKDIMHSDVKLILKRIESTKPTMAILARQSIVDICRYAATEESLEIHHTVTMPYKLKRHTTENSTALSKAELKEFLGKLENYSASLTSQIAMKLLFQTLVRTNELLEAEWVEIDIQDKLWRIPKERMKMGKAHTVPLTDHAIELLERLRVITGHSPYLFHNRANRNAPVSKGVLWKLSSALGYRGEFSPHGVRATASTMLNEMGFRGDIIEKQLAHSERNKVRASYNQAEYIEERRAMLEHWDTYLGSLNTPTPVIQGKIGKII